MARDKANQLNIDGSDLGNYPNKRIRNNDGSGNGTPVDESVYGDIHELMAKIMRESKTNYNGLPDNNSNGYQLFDAFLSLAGKNDFIKPLILASTIQVSIPVKVDALKVDESLVFKSTFDSTITQTQIKGSDGVIKTLNILGQFKTNDYVRLINTAAQVILIGLYDSANVPNLITRLTNIENAINPMIQKLAIFQQGGAVFIWRKQAVLIPAGYQEVTDMRGKTVFGLDISQPEFNVLGANIGSKNKTLSINEMPSHNHGNIPLINQELTNDGPTNGYGTTGASTPTSNQGGGQSFSILNPGRIVNYIEWAT
jgi:hypothetical protein